MSMTDPLQPVLISNENLLLGQNKSLLGVKGSSCIHTQTFKPCILHNFVIAFGINN